MYTLGRTGRQRSTNIWPGFVDGLATLLLVVIFVLMVFMVAQYFLSIALTSKTEEASSLDRQLAELGDLLALERDANSELRLDLAQISNELQSTLEERDNLSASLGDAQDVNRSLSAQLQGLLDQQTKLAQEMEAQRNALEDKDAALSEQEAALAALIAQRDSLASAQADAQAQRAALAERLADLRGELEKAYGTIEADKEKIETQLLELAIMRELRDQLERELKARELALEENQENLREAQDFASEQLELSSEAQRKVDLLNRQLAALRKQMASLNATLEAAEALNAEQKVQITDLGRRLNVALANKVQELARYRSEFFGRLREVLGDNPNIRIEGDRFVFQAELLFPSGSALLELEGQEQMADFAKTLQELASRIPEDIDWVLRVDGHTDNRPIATAQFPSNWELSSARAIEVVKFLIDWGIPPQRLVAAGFGEYRPLVEGDGPEALSKNRRIEFKLTER